MFSPIAVAALALVLQEASPEVAVAAATPPRGMPQIRSIEISTTEPHPGETVSGRVETSDNVPYVEARIMYYYQALHHDGEGRFSLSYKVPWWLPPWLRHRWDLQVIARSIDGVETKRIIPIRIH